MQRHKSILVFVIVLVAVAIAVIIRIPPRLGLDLQGGSQLTIQVKTTDKIREITAERLQDVLKIIENRVNGLGVSEALVQTSGDDQISVQLPGVNDPTQAERVLGGTAQLECHILRQGQVYIQDLAKVSTLEINEVNNITEVNNPDLALTLPSLSSTNPQPPTSPSPLDPQPKYWLLLPALPLFFILLVAIISLLGLGAIYQLLLKIMDREPLTQVQSTPKVLDSRPTDLPIIHLPQQSLTGVVGTVQVMIPLDGVVDLVALQSKLEKNLSKTKSEIDALTRRLSNSGFVDKAKPEVVQATRSALEEAEKQAAILSGRLSSLPPLS